MLIYSTEVWKGGGGRGLWVDSEGNDTVSENMGNRKKILKNIFKAVFLRNMKDRNSNYECYCRSKV